MFGIYKLVDVMGIYKSDISIDLSIGIVMRNPEMIKIFSDPLKIKK